MNFPGQVKQVHTVSQYSDIFMKHLITLIYREKKENNGVS